jgi:hypothetical protein
VMLVLRFLAHVARYSEGVGCWGCGRVRSVAMNA